MSHHSHISDYGRYFTPGQKVCLVNMSEGRNDEVYEALSGVVHFSGTDSVDLTITHGGSEPLGEISSTVAATYKLTTEALGGGVQVLADLIGMSFGNIMHFRMHGTLEMFQRRGTPRVDLPVRIFQMCGKYTLAFLRKEWKRVMDHMGNNGMPPGLMLYDAEINLSAGGVGFVVDPAKRPTPLSMIFIELDGGLPVCALMETAWEKRVNDQSRCGFRFINILKADQKRINNRVSDLLREKGVTPQDYTRNWVLVDKMVADARKPQ